MRRGVFTLLALAACGGDPTFDPPVDPGLPVAGLDAASIEATCDALAEFEDEVINDTTRSKLYRGEANAVFAHARDEPICSRVSDDKFLDDLPPVVACNLACIAGFDQCDATVGDFAACAEARLFAARERTESLECRLRDPLPPPEDTEACRALRERCRDSRTIVPADRVRC
ncbi:MAG: hypothetical protein RMA76_19615 [Deltaproteobacteria bacterium]